MEVGGEGGGGDFWVYRPAVDVCEHVADSDAALGVGSESLQHPLDPPPAHPPPPPRPAPGPTGW